MDNELVQVPQASLITGVNAMDTASKIATPLAKMISDQKLYTPIQGKNFVQVEGWTTMGAMMGVFPHVDECKKVPAEEGEIKYEATVSLITAEGKTITRASSICSNTERNKRNNEEYAIMSMAQTRATGKAFRLAFSWVMKLAGYEATPAEEMDFNRVEQAFTQESPAQAAQDAKGPQASEKQVRLIHVLLGKYGMPAPELKAKYKVESMNFLTKSQASEIIETLNQRIDAGEKWQQ